MSKLIKTYETYIIPKAFQERLFIRQFICSEINSLRCELNPAPRCCYSEAVLQESSPAVASSYSRQYRQRKQSCRQGWVVLTALYSSCKTSRSPASDLWTTGGRVVESWSCQGGGRVVGRPVGEAAFQWVRRRKAPYKMAGIDRSANEGRVPELLKI